MTKTRKLLTAALGVAISVATVGVAFSSRVKDDGRINSAIEVHGKGHSQHGGNTGHLAATSNNVRLVGKMRINQDFAGRVSDVNVHGNYAYLGAFWEPDCQKGGVYVFDISDLTSPKQVNFIRTGNNSYVGEGVHIVSINNASFKGDVLIHNNETCGPEKNGADGGISLVDVTNPKTEKYLARGVGDFSPVTTIGQAGKPIAHQVHSAFAWTNDANKTYVVMVDDEEGADVDIMDISDPRNPVLIAEHDLNVQFPQILDHLGAGESFFHDVVVKKIGSNYHMLLSYWDGGYVILNVNDPVNPVYVADSDFAVNDPQILENLGKAVAPEGNAHQAEFSKNNDYILAADEDFSPSFVKFSNVTDGTAFKAGVGGGTPALPGTGVAGRTVFVGRACNIDAAVPAGTAAARIAVVERGECTFTEKVANVSAAGGYSAVVIFNREAANAGETGVCNSTFGMSVDGATTAIGVIARDAGYALFNAAYNAADCADGTLAQAGIAVGTLGDEISVAPEFDGWGYIHLFRNGTGKLVELDTFALPESQNPSFQSGFGDLSVHEVAMSEVRNDIAYFSHYSGGFRVLKITADEKLQEVGRFIDAGGNNLWGVQVIQRGGKEYVLASDRDYGLYIFEYTGP